MAPIEIKGTFDWPSVQRWVEDMCKDVVLYQIQIANDTVMVTFSDVMSEDFNEMIRRVIRSNKFPFRKTYSGTFRPDRISEEIAALGFSVETCSAESVSVVYETPDIGMPVGLEAQLDDVVAAHNPLGLSPAEAHRQALVTAWGQYVGVPIASLQLEDLTQLVILYLSLNTPAVTPDGTIRAIV